MPLDIEVSDGLAFLTLNRPEALNAIDPELRVELQAAWRRIATDDSIRVAVLTGAGDRAFCVGADLKKTDPPKQSYASIAFGNPEGDHLLDGLDTDKPLICAINGYAIGGGLEIALACDIRICVPEARFGLGEVKVGTIPTAGGTALLPRVVNRSLAMQMLLTGDQIDAETALRGGLVSEITERDQLLERATAIGERIAANAPLAVRAVKRLVTRGSDLPVSTAMEMERFVWGLLRDTEDRLEGRSAFREKRPPRFRGQ